MENFCYCKKSSRETYSRETKWARFRGLGTSAPNQAFASGIPDALLARPCVSSQKVRLKWKELQKEHRRLILKLRHKQDGSQLCLSDNSPRMNSHDSMAGKKGQWHIRDFICHALGLWEPSKIKGLSTLFCPVLSWTTYSSSALKMGF